MSVDEIDFQGWTQERKLSKRRKKYNCDHCDEKYKNRSDVEEHIKSKHSTFYKCNKCEHIFTAQEDPKLHIEIYHGDRELCCNQCDKKLKSKAELEDHSMSQHKARSETECIKSAKTVSKDTETERLLKNTHTEERELCYNCDECEQKCNSMDTFQSHKKDKHSNICFLAVSATLKNTQQL